MLKERRVEFSEFALAGIADLLEDESRQKSFEASLIWYLRRDAEGQARECPAFPDRAIYVFRHWRARIVFEIAECVIIWSVKEVPDELVPF